MQMLGVTEGEVRNLINERVISLQLKRATERERGPARGSIYRKSISSKQLV